MTSFDNSGIVPPAPLAQSEEQRTFNPRVRGSKPRRGTTNLLAALPGRVAVRPRMLRRRVVAAAAGIILAGAGIGWVVDAHADTGTKFDWDSYLSVITGADSGVSTATSWMDLLLPPQMGGDR